MAVNLNPYVPGFDVFMAGSKAPGIAALGDAISKIAISPYEGQEFKQKLEHEKITNELNRQKQQQNELLMKYIQPMKEAELAYKQQRVGNPLLGMSGAAGQIGAQMWLQQHPEQNQQVMNQSITDTLSNFDVQQNKDQPNYADTLRRSIQANLNKNIIDTQLKDQQAKGYNWAHMTAETKNNMVAQGLAMNIDPMTMQKYVNEGMDLKQIAEKAGLDYNNLPAPRYFPTTTTKSRIQQVQQVGSELDYMSSRATKLIGDYADTFMGISPQRLKDMFSSDPEAQRRFGRYIAAMAIQSEIANGRVLLSGGRSGIEIIRELKGKSLAGLDQRSPIKMTKTAFQEAQKTIDDILQKGAQIRTKTGMSPFSQTSKPEESEDEDIPTYNPKTGNFE